MIEMNAIFFIMGTPSVKKSKVNDGAHSQKNGANYTMDGRLRTRSK
jgi:hypothetical protein